MTACLQATVALHNDGNTCRTHLGFADHDATTPSALLATSEEAAAIQENALLSRRKRLA
jgi:hypothetical protein